MEDDLRRLIAAHQDRVYNQAFRMLGNREDAEDAVQDVFLRVCRSLHKFRGESAVESWIYRITANVCITRLRRRRLMPLDLRRTEPDEGADPESLAVDGGARPDEALESKRRAEHVRAQVRSLPPKWAMAVSLYHFEGLSYEEVAEAMGVPRATVATYVRRGRGRLARKLMAVLE